MDFFLILFLAIGYVNAADKTSQLKLITEPPQTALISRNYPLLLPCAANFISKFFFFNLIVSSFYNQLNIVCLSWTEPVSIDINFDGNTKDYDVDNEESPLETSGNEEYEDENVEIDEEDGDGDGDELNEHNIEFRQRRHLGTKSIKVGKFLIN